ncbi:class I SAM-dependent methyltransferase [Sulfitobacter sp. LCG007]
MTVDTVPSAEITTFPDGIKVNCSIPRTMTMAGLHYLGRLARSVPENGTIVEVGPLYGSSTWVLRHNSHPSVKIFSLDTWDPQPWIERRLPDALPFGKDAYLHYIRDCENVEPIQGWSPQSVAETWDRPIDMFFDDATHGDPGFSANMNFFLPFVRDDGVLCGDDFASGWPDIIRVVTELARRWDAAPEVAGRVWSVLNNGGRGTGYRSVAEKIGPWTDADVTVRAVTADGTTFDGTPRMWTGQILREAPLTGLGIYPQGKTPVDGTLDLHLANGTSHKDLPFGALHSFDSPVVNFAVRLSDAHAKRHGVRYQCCEILDRKTLNSRTSRNGNPLQKSEENSLISAVRVEIT